MATMLKAMFASVALAITLVVAFLGVCTPSMMPSISSGLGDRFGVGQVIAQIEVHTETMNCMENSMMCFSSFDQHLNFLNSLLPSLNQEMIALFSTAFLFAASLIFVGVALRQLHALVEIANLNKVRMRRYALSFVEWFVLPTYTFAFSQGILNTKRYHA